MFDSKIISQLVVSRNKKKEKQRVLENCKLCYDDESIVDEEREDDEQH